MATTSFLVYSSLRSEEANKKIKFMIFVAPFVYATHPSKYVQHMVRLEPFIRRILTSLNIHSLYGKNDKLLDFFKNIVVNTRWKKFFEYTYSMTHGEAVSEYVDPKYVTLLLSQVPSEYSVKCFYHYAQIVRLKDRFQMYDYGDRKNLEIYRSPKPPEYPLEKIKIPFSIIYSIHDNYCTPQVTSQSKVY